MLLPLCGVFGRKIRPDLSRRRGVERSDRQKEGLARLSNR